MTRLIWFLTLISLVFACQPAEDHGGNSNRIGDAKSIEIIDRCIRAHGGERYRKHEIEFDFRGRHYISSRDGGQYTYERIFTDSIGQNIRDVLTNDSFVRYQDGNETDITNERKNAFSNSINSVIYFALLPYFLKDPAVISEYLGETSIKNEPYDKIKITFLRDGGGKDYEDQFLYWFHQEHHTLDYLAYNYQTDGGGSRFRQAINPRVVNGIRFADYINYKHPEETLHILNFDSLFENGGLDSLSTIVTENIVVK